MNRIKRIELILKKNFNEWNCNVIDVSTDHIGHNNFDGKNETHFKILLKNNNKIDLNRILIHRKINELLKDEFSNGLHALQIVIEN